MRLSIVTIAVALAGASIAAQQMTFRATTDAVTVDVSVRDRTKVVTDLKAADFTVLDNGVAQTVLDVTYGKLPIDVTIALDTSFSVAGPLIEELRKATVQLMSDLGKEDRLKLMLFSGRVSRVTDLTTDTKAVERAIRSATAGGGTAAFDAASVALVSAAEPSRRHLVVMFTDGKDSSSITSPEGLAEVARRTTARLTIVMPVPRFLVTPALLSQSGRLSTSFLDYQESQRQTRLWSAITRETGGTVVAMSPQTNVGAAFRRALEEFRTSYVLHFTPQGVDRAGFHTLQVKVAKPELSVTARRGYFGS
jgi:VWFA-related protein